MAKKNTGKLSFSAQTNPWAELDNDGKTLTVDVFPTTQIVRLGNLLRRTVTAPYAEQAGLTVSEWRILSLLEKFSPLAFSDLVVFSTSDKALVSRTMRLLEGRGLAQLELEKIGGKRLTCSITAQGRVLHRQVMPIAQERQANLLSALSREERVVLFEAVQKLHAFCEELERQGRDGR